MLAQSVKAWARTQILVHSMGAQSKDLLRRCLVSSVAQASSHYRNKMQNSVLINHQHAIDFHRCISFHVGIGNHATSRNGLDRIFLFVLLHISDYYFCYCPAGYVPSFCIHPNTTEFRPSTSSQFYSQSKKVQSSNYRFCRSAKVPLLWNHFLHEIQSLPIWPGIFHIPPLPFPNSILVT